MPLCLLYSQFYGLVPVDDVSRERERVHVDDVNVAPLRADVQPLALERQAHRHDPGGGEELVRIG